MVIQILLTFCSLFVIIRAFKSYRRKAVRFTTFFLWSSFWLALIFFLWQPGLTDRIASLLQVGRGADAVLYLSLVVIFILFFRIMVRLESIDAEMTTLVRELAILQKKEPPRS